MRHLLVLAAAAFLAVGCAGNKEDETGAAPARGDATVTATDSASMKTDSTMAAMPADTSAVKTDSAMVSGEATMGADSAAAQGAVQPTDSTSAAPADSTAAPADTTAK